MYEMIFELILYILFLCVDFVCFFGVNQPSVVEIVCKKRERGEWGERESFAPYYVTVVTPPPRNLGIHSLPPVRTIFLHRIAIPRFLNCLSSVQTDSQPIELSICVINQLMLSYIGRTRNVGRQWRSKGNRMLSPVSRIVTN